MIKPKFLEKSLCYFCSETIYNFNLVKLFDGREVKSCYECHKTIEIGKEVYFGKFLEVV